MISKEGEEIDGGPAPHSSLVPEFIIRRWSSSLLEDQGHQLGLSPLKEKEKNVHVQNRTKIKSSK